MKKLLICIAVAVATAGAAMPALASEDIPEFELSDNLSSEDFSEGELSDDLLPTPTPDIASESDSLGEFDSGESDADDMYQKLLDALQSVDFDFYSPDDGFDGEASPVPDTEFSDITTELDTDIELYSNYDVYYGAISSQYLEYMRGYLPKLGFREHYVGARVSQYQYIFAYGEDLSFSGSLFTGRDVHVITWFTNNNGSFSHDIQSSFNLSVGNYLVYSDLSDIYPALADLSAFTLRQLLILACIVSLVCTMSSMYQVRKIRKLGMH